MRPVSLHARNYTTWETLDLPVADGVTAIIGDNGAGKSKAMEIIDLSLFGGSLASYVSHGQTAMEIALVFDHGGRRYRARRSYDVRGRGKPTLDLEQAVPDYDEADLRAGIQLARDGIDPGLFYERWRPLTRETIRDTQTEIVGLLGISRDILLASAYVAQNDGARFCSADPRVRKQVLADILVLAVWDTCREQARAEVRAREADLAGAEATVENARRELADWDATSAEREQLLMERKVAENAKASAAERLYEARGRHERLREVKARALAAAREADRCEQALTAAVERCERLAEAIEALVMDTLDHHDVAARASLAAALEQRLAAALERDRLHAERNRLSVEIARLTDQRDAIDHGAPCPTCERPLGDESYEKAQAAIQRQLDALHAELWALPAAPDEGAPVAELETALADAREAARLLAAMDERAAMRDTLFAEQQHVTAEAADCRRDRDAAVLARDDLIMEAGDEDTAAAVAAADQLVTSCSESIASLDQRIARLDERLERYAHLDTVVGETGEQIAHLVGELRVLALVERCVGRDGAPALIVENVAIPMIEREANRILAALGGKTASCTVELRTQRVTKAGTVADVLDIVITWPHGAEQPYEMFSGGERERLNFAIRVGLARLLRNRPGAAVEFLAVDEPSGLDRQGREALVGVLRELEAEFPTILFSSQYDDLRDAFDQTVEVEVVDDTHSRLAGAEAPVAA